MTARPASYGEADVRPEGNLRDAVTESRRKQFSDWCARFAETGRPIPVRFSEMTETYHVKDRHTHVVHYYPAKLLSVIPEFFVDALTEPGDIVLDPFSGSGTVPLEAVLAGRIALATEINPLARLITSVKTTHLPAAYLRKQWSELRALIDLRRSSVAGVPAILRFWHSPSVLRQMSAIRNAIDAWQPRCSPSLREPTKDFFRLMFSSIVRRASLADPRIAPPVKLNPNRFKAGSDQRKRVATLLKRKRSADCLLLLDSAVETGIRRVDTLTATIGAPCKFVGTDAKEVPSNLGASLILTSPPYMAAQKYTRTTSLEMFWLGLLGDAEDRRRLETRVIGSEVARLSRRQACPQLGNARVDDLVSQVWKLNKSRAKIMSNYFRDMFDVLNRLEAALTAGGKLVVVVGNNTVCGKTIPVYQILDDWCRQQLALRTSAILVDPIRQFGMLTKRHKTAGIINREYVLIYEKTGVAANVSS